MIFLEELLSKSPPQEKKLNYNSAYSRQFFAYIISECLKAVKYMKKGADGIYKSEYFMTGNKKVKMSFIYPSGEEFGGFYEELTDQIKSWAEREYSEYSDSPLRGSPPPRDHTAVSSFPSLRRG